MRMHTAAHSSQHAWRGEFALGFLYSVFYATCSWCCQAPKDGSPASRASPPPGADLTPPSVKPYVHPETETGKLEYRNFVQYFLK